MIDIPHLSAQYQIDVQFDARSIEYWKNSKLSAGSLVRTFGTQQSVELALRHKVRIIILK